MCVRMYGEVCVQRLWTVQISVVSVVLPLCVCLCLCLCLCVMLRTSDWSFNTAAPVG